MSNPVSSTAEARDPLAPLVDGAAALSVADAKGGAAPSAAEAKAAAAGKPKKEKKDKKGGAGAGADAGPSVPLEFTPPPPFFAERMALFDRLLAEQDAERARAAEASEEIDITMPDGSVRKGHSWKTSPMDIAREISKSLSERIVISKVRRSAELRAS
jgi:threonyl-tRNA synthetase